MPESTKEGQWQGVRDWFSTLESKAGLSPKGRLLARYVVSNPKQCSVDSATTVGSRVGTTASTVVRFAQALGFSGWPDFQRELRLRLLRATPRTDLLLQSTALDSSIHRVHASLRRDADNLHTALETIDTASVTRAAERICKSDNTLVVAEGSYAAPALILAHLGGLMGHRIRLETGGRTQLVSALSTLDSQDCLVAVAFWRLPQTTVKASSYCQQRSIPTVAITDSQQSELAAVADTTIIVPSEGLSFFQSMTAPTSLIYGLLAEMERLSGRATHTAVTRTQLLWEEFEVLHRP